MKKRMVLAAMGFVAAVAFSSGCEKMKATEGGGSPNTGQPAAEVPADTGPATSGTVATVAVGPANFSIEIADTDEAKARGLMGRESIPDNGGMWFVFPASGTYEFWMKDTLIPLDWIFVDTDATNQMKVVGIKADNKPGDETKYAPPVPFRYALEVKGGEVAKQGIKEGDVVLLRIGPATK